MLEQLDLTKTTPKEEYKPAHDELISRLVLLQQHANQKGIGLVVLFEGWNGAGKGSRIGDLLYNLDARMTSVHTLSTFHEKEARYFRDMDKGVSGFYPMMQEFWKALGPRGNMTIFERGWYTAAAKRMAYTDKKDYSAAYSAAMGSFERQLAADGYLVVKFFFHISQEKQKERLTKLHENSDTAWRVTQDELDQLKDYDKVYRSYDELLCATDYDFAPWVMVNGEDKRTANLTIARTLVEVLDRALDKEEDPSAAAAAEKAAMNSAGLLQETDPRTRSEEETAAVNEAAKAEAATQALHAPRHTRFTMIPNPPRLNLIDYSLTLDREAYKKELKREQKRLYELENKMYRARIPMLLVYEGDDASGKGGNIKRVAQALDARSYTIFPSGAPTKPELMRPHLWRYWTRLPKAGHVGIYDRSWYGRVLVERVEGFASPEEWARAYDEINEFERDLQYWGAILLKFWVAVDNAEQLRRFQEREANPEKQWKITAEDWRNRDKHPQYGAAVNDMFRLTSTPYAPWIILESSDKYYARVKALKIINETLEKRLGIK